MYDETNAKTDQLVACLLHRSIFYMSNINSFFVQWLQPDYKYYKRIFDRIRAKTN